MQDPDPDLTKLDPDPEQDPNLLRQVPVHTCLDEEFVEAEIVADGVLKTGFVGEEDGVAAEDPLVDLSQLHHLVRAAHDGRDDEVLVGHLLTEKKILFRPKYPPI